MDPTSLGKLCVEWLRQNGNDLEETIAHYARVYAQEEQPIRNAAHRELERLRALGIDLPPTS
jgi:hypothetical protein